MKATSTIEDEEVKDTLHNGERKGNEHEDTFQAYGDEDVTSTE